MKDSIGCWYVCFNNFTVADGHFAIFYRHFECTPMVVTIATMVAECCINAISECDSIVGLCSSCDVEENKLVESFFVLWLAETVWNVIVDATILWSKYG